MLNCSAQVVIHEDLLQYCIDRLRASYDTVSALDRDKDSMNRIYQEASRMIRVMTVLHEYVAECDDAHGEERAILPLARLVYLHYLYHGFHLIFCIISRSIDFSITDFWIVVQHVLLVSVVFENIAFSLIINTQLRFTAIIK